MQERCNSIANALEILLSCTNPSTWDVLYSSVTLSCFLRYVYWSLFSLYMNIRARFLSLAWSKLRLCWLEHDWSLLQARDRKQAKDLHIYRPMFRTIPAINLPTLHAKICFPWAAASERCSFDMAVTSLEGYTEKCCTGATAEDRSRHNCNMVLD